MDPRLLAYYNRELQFLRELGAGLINGIAIALVAGLCVFAWQGDSRLALVIGDTTRVATYQLSSEDGHGICDRFPGILKIGNGKHGGHHGLSHSEPSKDSSWGEYDRYLAEQFAYFLTRLSAIREGETRVLDRTLAMFGSGTSSTHNARNYPIVLAGGKDFGLRHGQYIKAREERPLGDLFVTMLQRLDFPVRKFADNAGEFSEIV